MKLETSAFPVLDTIKSICYFAVLGPPLGVLGFALYFAGYSALRGDLSGIQNSAAIPLMAFFIWFLPYMFGIVPAAACGLICGPFRPSFRSWSACLVAGAVGGLLSAFWSEWQFGRPHEERLLFFVIGLTAAFLCARVFAVRASAGDRSAAR